MNDFVVLKSIDLLAINATATGKTIHKRGGRELPLPAYLNVTQFSGDPGFYLLYFDDQGNELTDTYHNTLSAALNQAEFEFNVVPTQWVDGELKKGFTS